MPPPERPARWGLRLLMLEHVGRVSGRLRYASRHPRAWRRLGEVLEAALDAPVERLPIVRRTLQSGHAGHPGTRR